MVMRVMRSNTMGDLRLSNSRQHARAKVADCGARDLRQVNGCSRAHELELGETTRAGGVSVRPRT